MQRVLDMLVVVNGAMGMVGLGYIAFATPSTTQHHVDVYMAMTLLVLVGVIIPFLMARSLEKLALRWPKLRLVPRRARSAQPSSVEIARHTPHDALSDDTPEHTPEHTPENVPTPYFDYLRNLDAPPPTTNAPPRKKSRGDAHLSAR